MAALIDGQGQINVCANRSRMKGLSCKKVHLGELCIISKSTEKWMNPRPRIEQWTAELTKKVLDIWEHCHKNKIATAGSALRTKGQLITC